MEKILYPSSKRGNANHGWLNAYHTFSFGNFYDPRKVNFGALRVLNDDTVAAGMGFSKHRHDNMEIVTIPLSGALKHADSEGNSEIIYHGDVQHMSAGTGIYHSEMNANPDQEVKLFQIWIFPKYKNIKPAYHQKSFNIEDRQNKFQLIVSPAEADNVVLINQDAAFYLGDFEENYEISFQKKFPENYIFLMVIEGKIEIEGEILGKRDAIGLIDIDNINIKSLDSNTQLLLIEIPK
jgi:redox-sensitive bicupin YhaK (pirin superfamily)